MSQKNRKDVDPESTGGKLRLAREEKGLNIRQLGYDHGYISRIERNFLPITSTVLAAYEKAVGHPIDVIPQDARPNKEKRERLIEQALTRLSAEWIQNELGTEITDLLFDLLQAAQQKKKSETPE